MSRLETWFAKNFKTALTEDEYRAFVEPPNMAWTCADLCSLFVKHHPCFEDFSDMVKPCIDRLINQVFLQRKLTRIRRYKKLLLPVLRMPTCVESAFKADQDSAAGEDADQASKDRKDSVQPFLLAHKPSKAVKDRTVPKSRPPQILDQDEDHEGKSDALFSSRRRTRSASSLLNQDHQRSESKKSKKHVSNQGSHDSKVPAEQVENSRNPEQVVARKRGRPRKHPVVAEEK